MILGPCCDPQGFKAAVFRWVFVFVERHTHLKHATGFASMCMCVSTGRLPHGLTRCLAARVYSNRMAYHAAAFDVPWQQWLCLAHKAKGQWPYLPREVHWSVSFSVSSSFRRSRHLHNAWPAGVEQHYFVADCWRAPLQLLHQYLLSTLQSLSVSRACTQALGWSTT